MNLAKICCEICVKHGKSANETIDICSRQLTGTCYEIFTEKLKMHEVAARFVP